MHDSVDNRRTWLRALVLVVSGLLLTDSANGSPAVPAGATGQDTPNAESAKEPEKPKFKAGWYGYVKLDAAWDDSLIEPGNFARWVASPSIVEEHAHFNMTARQSRLGIDITHETGDGPPVSAKLEIDFYGGGAENKNRPQLRHAYFDFGWPEHGWTLRAGQTSDVISPLVPTTLNYTVAWWVGNIGYRRPMVRATKTLKSEAGNESLFTAALSRTIGDDFGSVEPGDSGVDSGVPTLQLAFSRSLGGSGGRRGKIGLSGHWGREHLEEGLGLPAPNYDSWSANLDFLVPLASRGTLKGEAWMGQNLDDYFGGVGQGIDFDREREIEAMGGWLAYEIRARPDLLATIGLGLDDPDNATLPGGARSRNRALWANFLWDFRPALRFGLEGSWWQTDYLDLEDGSSFRLQSSLIFSFAG